MQLSLRDYFTPFATMKVLRGTPLQRRETLLFNCTQRDRVAEVAHRWGQVAALCAAGGALAYTHGWTVGVYLGVVGLILAGPIAIALGTVWLVLYLTQKDLQK